MLDEGSVRVELVVTTVPNGLGSESPGSAIHDVAERFWKWHRLRRSAQDLLDNLVVGDLELQTAEGQVRGLMEVTDDRTNDYLTQLAQVPCRTADDLKSKAKVIQAAFEGESDDPQVTLIRSLLSDLVRMPLREVAMPRIVGPT